jgi:hypothetical protein
MATKRYKGGIDWDFVLKEIRTSLLATPPQ